MIRTWDIVTVYLIGIVSFGHVKPSNAVCMCPLTRQHASYFGMMTGVCCIVLTA